MPQLTRTSETKKNRKKKAAIVLVVVLVLIIGLFFRNQSAVIVHTALVPINTAFEFIAKPFKNVPAYFASKTELQNQNTKLSERNKTLEIEILSLMSLQNQNRELRGILSARGDQVGINRILGRVVLTPPFSPFDTLVANVSGEQEINLENLIDQDVFVQNILIGKVKEIHGSNLIVKLFSSYGQTIPVRINDEIVAEAEGRGGLSFQITIPRDVDVPLYSPIFSMSHPDSIIGKVEYIDSAETSSFQTIFFQYPINYSAFNYVEITH